MILADTSIWIQHFRSDLAELEQLLNAEQILCHPFVIGEIALGSIRQRAMLLRQLHRLPRCSVASDAEVLEFVDSNALFDRGIGYIDVHLLAAVQITPGATLWTFDKRLHEAAGEFGVAFRPGS